MTNKKHLETLAVLLAVGAWAVPLQAQHNYKSFIVSTYATQGTVQGLMDGNTDPAASWATLTRNLKVDKIYIEVMRNHTLVDEAGLEKLKKFYQDQGAQVCGGLAYSISEFNGFQGFDYADPENRDFAKKAAEMAARHFDEILLDDYYFFDRKTDADIKAKGDKTWTALIFQARKTDQIKSGRFLYMTFCPNPIGGFALPRAVDIDTKPSATSNNTKFSLSVQMILNADCSALTILSYSVSSSAFISHKDILLS